VRPLGPDTGLKLTTARYYTPSGVSIQGKGIVPDVMVDETPEGNLFSALRTREADLNNSLGASPHGPMTDAQRDAEKKRDEAREVARKKLEEEAKKNPGQRLVPEFGSDKDFQVQQALNQLKGRPVLVSKSQTVRPEEKKEN
jgi:carboxyl-terminal processing protease